MSQTRIDPRITRTRNLIMDAFVQLSMKKEFKDITIKDITDEATVNRATFYSHFTDKYQLLDAVLTEDLMTKIFNDINLHDELSEESIIKIFLSITTFQSDLSTQCKRSYDAFMSSIEAKLKAQLEELFCKHLIKNQPQEDPETLRIASVMLSWGIYGASVDWQHNSKLTAEQYIQKALPPILNGMKLIK
ncbi:TetR/AcrR family transcriptional regulator [Psychrobacillus vulpis]|uniref:TetR/AcrR family transcriptional regulator n=1 Tax=Psychrobacillus vulpis TaxID=2325572 RepID=A0A544TW95_9BACI|nr:TetR/AcrR family transcriptional regulator [Psychrobacillus vulpis]TQR21707.1 TetR/AcrR family transcriptional regulator [Psychrobacillus vulpis]